MSTNNFANHENGIFVIKGYDFDEVKADILENLEWNDMEASEVTDEYVYETINNYNEDYYTDWLHNLPELEKYYDIYVSDSHLEAEIYNKQGKKVADLRLESGYYEDVQVIVETDPYVIGFDGYFDTQAELLEQYTPNHKRLLNILGKITTPIVKVGQFNNGEALYSAV
jgi:hypothetical protein